MKTPSLFLAIVVAFIPVIDAPPVAAQLSTGGLGDRVKKIRITGTVLQVLDEGLLMHGSRAPYLIVRHPDQATMADGDRINCYVTKTQHTFTYTDTTGAQRRVRIYLYANERKGR